MFPISKSHQSLTTTFTKVIQLFLLLFIKVMQLFTEHVKIGNPQKRELDNFGNILFFA
jgi:hypothetical protein